MLCRRVSSLRAFCTFSSVSYIQGQEPEPKIREYFYYVDHQGMSTDTFLLKQLFLDDARMKNFTSCFKEKKFLKFFFTQLRKNDTGRYPEFPYLSICGKERNFIRTDDLPIVYTHVENDSLVYNHGAGICNFQPDKLFMSINSGRVYHPASKKHGGIGLIRSNLAIEFSKGFKFENGESQAPTHFHFNGTLHELDNSWHKDLVI